MNEHYKFSNMPLPYCYAALEPYIDERTVELHHDRHLQKYIDDLNDILEHYPRLQGWSLEQLLTQRIELPEQIVSAIRFNAGGTYNHFLYFNGLSPKPTQPSGELSMLFDRQMGGFHGFSEQLSKAASSVRGSGYAWLCIDRHINPTVMVTSNQSTPLTENLYPLICIDVWEHAYYLLHYNLRGDYIENWFKVANWQYAGQRLMSALKTV